MKLLKALVLVATTTALVVGSIVVYGQWMGFRDRVVEMPQPLVELYLALIFPGYVIEALIREVTRSNWQGGWSVAAMVVIAIAFWSIIAGIATWCVDLLRSRLRQNS